MTTNPTTQRFETIRFDRDGPVGWLRLDRPDKLNALSLRMWRELAELGHELVDDPDLRAVVVIGEGRAFSSGIDLSIFAEGRTEEIVASEAAANHADPVVAGILRAQDAYTWLEEAPFATVAAVRGFALGAGLQLALACDIRVVARGSVLGLLELKYGMIPDLGGTQRLPRLVGAGKAKELILTGARIDAEEAARVGLAERVVDDADLERAVAELAATLAAQPPLAVLGVKRAIAAAATLPVREGLVVEAEHQARCLRSDDLAEAMAAFVEQRPPRYNGR